jgi:threonine aldolase
LVSIENTVNKGGGACWDLAEVERIRAVCDQHGLGLHLDGARIFNAMVARGDTPKDYGRLFDTISICLSKGLGAPAGSLLIGTHEAIARAHRYRKMMGGGMRQAGYLAAAGLFALEHNVNRLRDDHAKARVLERELRALPYVASVLPVETNIVIFSLAAGLAPEAFLRKLQSHGLRASGMGAQTIRFVFHLDISDDQLDAIVATLRKLDFA